MGQNDGVEMRTVSVDERPVCCRVVVPGVEAQRSPVLRLPVVLLHGLGCSGNAWGRTPGGMAEAGAGRGVYAPDFPGYGDSRGPGKALGMAELADWVVRFLDEIGVERAHLAGNSMGCQVALEVARRHPERVGGLVLVGPTTGSRRVSYWRYMAGLGVDGFREPVRYNLTLVKMYGQMGLRRYLATVGKMREDEPLEYAGEVFAPCLVLRGEWDGIVPEAVARELADALPRGRFIPVKGAAHALQFHATAEFVRLAVPFWREAEG